MVCRTVTRRRTKHQLSPSFQWAVRSEGLRSSAHRRSSADHNVIIRRSPAQVIQLDFLTFTVLLTRQRKVSAGELRPDSWRLGMMKVT